MYREDNGVSKRNVPSLDLSMQDLRLGIPELTVDSQEVLDAMLLGDTPYVLLNSEISFWFTDNIE